jgi:hypothetical protein
LTLGRSVGAPLAVGLLAVGVLTVPCAAASSPPLVLKLKKHVLHAGMKIGGELHFSPCKRFWFHGRLESNGSPQDTTAVRTTEDGANVCEGGPAISGTVGSVTLTGGGEFTVLAHIRFETGVVAPKHCVWEITELKGTFAIPGPAATQNLSGVGALNAQESAVGCPPQENFREVEAAMTKRERQLTAEAG